MLYSRILLSLLVAICSSFGWAQTDEIASTSTSAPPIDPTASASAPVNPPANKENFHIYLLMGQSNMVGRDIKGMDTAIANPRILALDQTGHWVEAHDPLHYSPGKTPAGVGPGLSFAAEMFKSETDSSVVIGLVPCAVGGTPLKRWEKQGGRSLRQGSGTSEGGPTSGPHQRRALASR